jgi:arginyl-tRNA synthetase
MKIRINPEVTEQIPGINISVMVIRNIRNDKKRSDVSQLLRGLIAGKKRELKSEVNKAKINEILRRTTIGNQMLAETRLLKSSLNKIVTGKNLAATDSLTDMVNYLSIKYIVPVMGYDLDQVEKDLEVSLIVPKQGKKSAEFDFSRETKNIVLWLVNTGSVSKEEFEKLPDEFGKLISKYCGGITEAVYALNVDNGESDLNYTSEKELEYIELQKKEEEENALKEHILTSNEPPFEAQESDIPDEPIIKEKLREAVAIALKKILARDGQPEPEIPEVNIEIPTDHTHGDYSVSVAMKMTKIVQKAPQEIAQEIIDSLPPLDFVDKTEIAGPGFVNFFLSAEFLQKELENVLRLRQNYGRLGTGKNKKVVIDYSSPNIAKPLGVHHLLSTIIGQVIADILRFSGYTVASVNYLGDWGTQYGKLIYAYKTWGNRDGIEKDPLNELLKLYVKFHDEAEKEPALEDKGREEFKKLEEGDEENRQLLDWMRSMSIKELERIYKTLGVSFDEYLPESKYPDVAKKMVEEGKEKGIVVEGEKGALIVKFDEDVYPPFILRKSDGTTIYGTRDLASIKDRVENLKADILLYVVDVAQTLHFKQLFETARKFGFTDTDLHHIVFGRMQLPEGRMSTRKGDVILLDEVIKEAVSRTETLIAEKSPELDAPSRARLTQDMAVSAIKYNIISQNRETNITFEWDKMLSLDGNSGPYLQYASARAQSILRKYVEQSREKKTEETPTPSEIPAVKNKNQTDLFSMAEEYEKKEKETGESTAAQTSPETIAVQTAGETSSGQAANEGNQSEEALNAPSKSTDEDAKPFSHESEKKLLRLIPRFPEYVALAAREYKPNLLSNYLFDLARAFSAFYNEVQVLNAATEELKMSRIKLVQAVAQVLNNGLKVLGIAIFDRM